ncbi:hypothetical protein [Mucilaginibacter endophyticus]|uniref:hypothetical protein n=1 Tax=Mucilaginibacter endophyticus TaxID=2675003 RepID=UPI000E0DB30C|nr:hypothetical protein [Mucilaginibacter endophyticus]
MKKSNFDLFLFDLFKEKLNKFVVDCFIFSAEEELLIGFLIIGFFADFGEVSQKQQRTKWGNEY